MKKLLNRASLHHVAVSLFAVGALAATTVTLVPAAFAAPGTPTPAKLAACGDTYKEKATTGPKGVSVALEVQKLAKGAQVTAMDASANALKFQEPHKPKTDSISAGDNGVATGSLQLIPGVNSAAGTHILTVKVTPQSGTSTSCTLTVKTTAIVTAGKSPSIEGGTKPAPFLISNLPKGAHVTKILTGSTIYWQGDVTAVQKDNGYVATVTTNKPVPHSPGDYLHVTATTANGQPVMVDSSLNISLPTQEVNPGFYGANCVPATLPGGETGHEGLFESAYNPKTGKLFVTYAPFDADQAGIARLDGQTLKREAFHQAEGVTEADGKAKNESEQAFGSLAEHQQLLKEGVKPGAKPDKAKGTKGDVKSGGYYKPFGITLDNTHGYVWVSNSITDTVSLYRQSDLSLVRRWPVGTLNHGFDILVPDESTGIAYATDGRHNQLVVLDPTKQTVKKVTVGNAAHPIASITKMAVDGEGNIYLVSRLTPWGVQYNYKTGIQHYFPLDTRNNMGIAYDTKRKLVYYSSQDDAQVNAVDPVTGEKRATIYVPAQPLHLTYDPATSYLHVLSRSGGTITTIDTNTFKVIALRKLSPFPNHLSNMVGGYVYYVDKNPAGNKICRLQIPAAQYKQPVLKPGTGFSPAPPVPAQHTPKATVSLKAAPAAKHLANTGTTVSILLAIAIALIAAGTAVAIARRRV